MRLGSQYAATYEMIDWTRNVLDLPRTKNDEAVHTPLNADVVAVIRSLPSWQERTGPIFRNQRHPEKPVLSNDHWFKPAMKEAGIGNFKRHVCFVVGAGWRAARPCIEAARTQEPDYDDEVCSLGTEPAT